MTADVFGTAALRAAVLGAWRSSPTRLREDANTEEDHARGYYRDRVIVELAQNAADAATRAGVPGRLLLRLARTDDDGTVLVAANTGAPLDAEGVASLASMRASAKRDEPASRRTVGRFGVGFAAVRAVADEVSVLSTTGGVRFSAADAAELLAEAALDNEALADEVRRRDGSLPALRLPLPTEGSPPTGYDTAVVLELRDEVAADEVRSLLHDVGDPLLLALPGLVEILVDDDTGPARRIADVADRWTVATGEGELPLALMADRPVEERAARAWRVTWALPRGGAQLTRSDQVVHAPTPTDEPCSVPALLVATFPLDPSRRHVAPGPLTDAVLDHAADVYARLAHGRAAAGHDALALVPTGLAAGALDAGLRDRIVERLTRTPLLVPAAPDEATPLVVPARAVALAGSSVHAPAALEALGRRIAALVVLPSGRETQARALGVEIRPLADVVEDLPAVSDGGWAELYDALALLADDPQSREALGAVPVPLADGRVVRGARGSVLLEAGLADRLGEQTLQTLGRWGLRVVDWEAAHPVLERLGAQAVDAVGLLGQDPVRQAVLELDDDEPDDVVDAVLTLVAALDGADLPREAVAWLGLLPLPAADGERTPADSLVLPGSVAATLLDDRVLSTVSTDAVERWGRGTLVAVGVRADLALVHVGDVLADPASLRDGATDSATLAAQSLDGWDDYLAHLADRLGAGAYVGEAVAVADLDAVDPERWPQVLARIAADPALHRALVDPVRGESSALAPSYTSWWLRERADLGLGRPFAVGDELGALLPPAPDLVANLDATVQRALGGIGTLDELDGPGWTHLLDSWGPVGVPVEPALATAVWQAMAPDEPPERLPALVGPGRVAVVHAEDAAVAEQPMWHQRTDVAALVPGTDVTARLLDLPFAGDLADGLVGEGGDLDDVPAGVRSLLPDAPSTWVQHDDLLVDGTPVDWWVDDDGPVVHAVHLVGLAAGLAQAAGRWDLRYAVEALLTDTARADEIALDVAGQAWVSVPSRTR